MIVKINKSKAFGRVLAPPSKSMAHRYLICGALSGGSRINGIAFSEDIKATLSCLEALGADIRIEGDAVEIGGLDISKKPRSTELFCNESGSTLRFLIPICLLFGEKMTVKGTERLMQRSLSVYEDMCRSQSLLFIKDKNSVTLKGRLTAGRYSVRGDISSQFISGLMFALPLVGRDSIIDITGVLESGSYLSLTAKALADFGVRTTKLDENTIYIKGGQSYKKRELKVEGDYSNAAFFDALNTIGGNVRVAGLSYNSVQGDSVYKKLFAKIIRGCPVIDISDCPDLGPVLMAAAAANKGAYLTGTHRLKIKESDRGAAMAEELAKFGCKLEVYDNAIRVNKAELHTPRLPLSGHNDHRIVMALSLLCTLTGGEIYGAEAVSKSFPDFFEKLSSLGIDLKVDN